MDTKNQSVKSSHQCTSDCNNTKDCPVCPHGYDEENFCSECDEITEIKKDEQARVGSGWIPTEEGEIKKEDFENPYRHIEEANEENYKAIENK